MFRPTLEFAPDKGGLHIRATRHKMFGGGVSHRFIPGLTVEQFIAWVQGAGHIQNVLAHINIDDREFLLTGLNPGEKL